MPWPGLQAIASRSPWLTMSDSAPRATPYRYAAYFAPAEGSVWCKAGSHWVGRCAAQRENKPQPVVRGVSRSLQQCLTQAPRRYGWHATLKAPFALAPGADFESLRQRLRELCRELEAFMLPALHVQQINDFLALVPEGDTKQIDSVAAVCVTGLHALAAPLSAVDLERRRAAPLTRRQDALLLRWGYPFVLDDFRFHMSLTGSLSDAPAPAIEAMKGAALQCFGALPPCRFDSVALFAEPYPGADFVLVEHVRLGT